ncbi:MAG TPA: 4-hydroxy-tetrahydrodipicolinate synthase [Steroidobacteraceae bacterium]|nr:4-hydroxy-tetrahydrodipicolinate synthase [Steroidobacteraceae bacterium]
MTSPAFAGAHVALVTPFRDDGEVDFSAWARLLDWHVASGTDGVVVGGSTGESPTVTEAELLELVRRARAQVGGRMQVIVGCGSNSTATTVARARSWSAEGVDGLLIATPAYNKPTQEGLFRHFEAAAEVAAVPVILYNVPSRTAVDMLPETVARLARLPQVRAIKEAVPEMARIDALVAQCPAGFAILSGDDATARDAIGHGACGVISVTGNVAPALMSRMIAAARAGDAAQAAALDAQLSGLHEKLFVESNPIPVKWALERMGTIRGRLRLPLTPLSQRHFTTVEAALVQAGVALAAAA